MYCEDHRSFSENTLHREAHEHRSRLRQWLVVVRALRESTKQKKVCVRGNKQTTETRAGGSRCRIVPGAVPGHHRYARPVKGSGKVTIITVWQSFSKRPSSNEFALRGRQLRRSATVGVMASSAPKRGRHIREAHALYGHYHCVCKQKGQ